VAWFMASRPPAPATPTCVSGLVIPKFKSDLGLSILHFGSRIGVGASQRSRPEGAQDRSHGWSPPQADGTRGEGTPQISLAPKGRRRGVGRVTQGTRLLRPFGSRRNGGATPTTGSAALHPWLRSSAPLGPP
jgi:hypothetical protein